ncbi:MAG: Na/Pi cotransporter family protein [Chitinivibrionales bacterium]
MNWLDTAFTAIGGLALFLFGIHTMSDGLRAASGDGIRKILSNLTKNRVIALLVGTLVTLLVQSSSATTVMTVGFANAGLLTFKQAISLVLGANIGTTFTAWIVSIIGKFSISAVALPAIGIGFGLIKFVKRGRKQDIGNIILGFGLLFFGLDIMKDAFKPLSQSQAVIDMFANFSHNPLLGVLVGTIFTMIVQSSSATIAIVQTLAFNGIIGFDAAIPLILGDNIGTTITAELAAIGTNVNAERTARAHTLFNVIGTVIVLPFVWVGAYGRLVEYLHPGVLSQTNVMMHIAFAHSLFNILNAIVFTIFLNFLTKMTMRLSFGKDSNGQWVPKYLKESLLSDPFVATEQVIKELVRMTEISKEIVIISRDAFFKEDQKCIDKVHEGETALDNFQHAITSYMIRISEESLDTRESMEYPVLLHTVNDLEKIGDYADNIAGYAEIRMRKKLSFAPEGVEEISSMFEKLCELFDKVTTSLQERNSLYAQQAIKIEDQIDTMKSQVRENHIKRLQAHDTQPEAEMMIMDLATNIEKMGDHLTSIAKAVRKDLKWGRSAALTDDASLTDEAYTTI